MTDQPPLLERATDAVSKVLEDHTRQLAPSGTGVQCRCGEHYRTHTAWRRHQSELATAAVKEVMG